MGLFGNKKNTSCPLPSMEKAFGSCSSTLKYNTVIKSAQPKEPPVWPDFAEWIIRMTSRLTWVDICLSCSVCNIFFRFIIGLIT